MLWLRWLHSPCDLNESINIILILLLESNNSTAQTQKNTNVSGMKRFRVTQKMYYLALVNDCCSQLKRAPFLFKGQQLF